MDQFALADFFTKTKKQRKTPLTNSVNQDDPESKSGAHYVAKVSRT